MRVIALGIVMCTLSACTTLSTPRPLADARAGATTFHQVRVGRMTRTFLLHLPPAAASGRVPLVLVFHGHTGNAEVALRTSRMNSVADSLGMAIAYADGSGRVRGIGLSWNVGTCCGWAQAHDVDEISFIDSLRVTLARTGLIDSTKVFATGFSAGGMLALKAACERSTTLRGVVDFAGAMPNSACAPASPIPVMLVRGDDDDDLREDYAIQLAEGAPPYATSVAAAAAFWRHANRCRGELRVTRGLVADSGLRTRVATGCAAGGAVALVSIPKHPHAWPGGRTTWWFAPRPSQAISGSKLALQFFAAQLARDDRPQ